MAAVTERIELATGVLILPQRNPIVLAKQAATLMQLSPVEAGTARRYADLGVDELVIFGWPAGSPADADALLERHADLPR
jgi:hypothetical protein